MYLPTFPKVLSRHFKKIILGVISIMIGGVLYFFYGVERDYVFSDTIEPTNDHLYTDKYIYRYDSSWYYHEPELKPRDRLNHSCWFDAFTLKENLPLKTNEEALKYLNKGLKAEIEIPVKNGADVIIIANEQTILTKWFPRSRLTNELFNPFALNQKAMERYYEFFLARDKNSNIIPTTQSPILRELPECERHLEDSFEQKIDPDTSIRRLRQQYVFQLRKTYKEKRKELVSVISDPDTLVSLHMNCHYNTHIFFYSLRKKIFFVYKTDIPYLHNSKTCPLIYKKS